MRSFIHSDSFVSFVNSNEHLTFDIIVKRNHHPFVSATYINGFVNDYPLRLTEDVHQALTRLNETCKY